MTIKQFNGSYLIHEDRILFRFNTHKQEEYRFWFTRRITQFILGITSHMFAKKFEETHSLDAAKALREFENQTIIESVKSENQISQNYEPGLIFPLGFDPLLVMDVSFGLMKDDKKIEPFSPEKMNEIGVVMSLDFMLPGGANLNLKLDQSTLQMMRVLLDQLNSKTTWGKVANPIKNHPQDEQDLHLKSSKNISIH